MVGRVAQPSPFLQLSFIDILKLAVMALLTVVCLLHSTIHCYGSQEAVFFKNIYVVWISYFLATNHCAINRQYYFM